MSQLVHKLSTGNHPIEITVAPARSPKALKECIDRGYVHVKFTDTLGGTNVGVKLDREASDFNADFEKGTGSLKLVGSLTLDYIKVQCIAEIDIGSFTGRGHLSPIM